MYDVCNYFEISQSCKLLSQFYSQLSNIKLVHPYCTG